MIQLQTEKECYQCGAVTWLENHHVLGGPLCKKSEKFNLKVWLCNRHHTQNVPGDAGVHHNRALDLTLKRLAQQAFVDEYGADRWMEVFSRNYLE